MRFSHSIMKMYNHLLKYLLLLTRFIENFMIKHHFIPTGYLLPFTLYSKRGISLQMLKSNLTMESYDLVERLLNGI